MQRGIMRNGTTMYDSLWHWMEAVYLAALRDHNQDQIMLIQRVEESYDLCEHQPQAAINSLQLGRERAQALGASCWLLVFDLLLAEMYLFHMVDNNSALDIAAKAVVEARKPHYENCPARLPLINTLIHTYSVIDPYGYSTQILDLIGYAQHDTNTDAVTNFDLQLSRAKIHVVLGDMQQAQEIALRGLAHESRFIVFNTHIVLCHIMRETQQAQQGLQYAQIGMALLDQAELSNPNQMLSLLWAYVALFAQQAGDPDEAEAYYQRAQASETLLKIKPYYNVPDTLSSYKQAVGDYDTALRLRRQHLTEAEAAGSRYAACIARVRLCRLLGVMQDHDGLQHELALARAAANRLQKPDKILRLLQRVADGDYTE